MMAKKSLEKKAALSRLLQSERKVKLRVLKSQVQIYGPLLYCLFNENDVREEFESKGLQSPRRAEQSKRSKLGNNSISNKF